MKFKVLLLAAIGLHSAAFAQIKLPQVSGAAEVEQTIGYTKIEIDYARPNLNNRKAFGGELAPFGQVWRTGANNNTTMEISTDITIEGKKLTKGTYAIFATPNAKSWDIIFYTKTDNWGVPKEIDEKLVALKLQVPTQKTAEKIETFTIGFSHASLEQATLFMAWENTKVEMKINAETKKMAEEVLKNDLNEKSSGRDYFSAAYYYYSNKLDMKQALVWINTAIEKDPETPFYKDYKKKIEEALKK
jgi:hypothetical protein